MIINPGQLWFGHFGTKELSKHVIPYLSPEKYRLDSIKGIFTDSNNIFLWHKSEGINKKKLFPKFQLIQIFGLQVMHDFVYWHSSIDYCVKLIFRTREFMLKML